MRLFTAFYQGNFLTAWYLFNNNNFIYFSPVIIIVVKHVRRLWAINNQVKTNEPMETIRNWKSFFCKSSLKQNQIDVRFLPCKVFDKIFLFVKNKPFMILIANLLFSHLYVKVVCACCETINFTTPTIDPYPKKNRIWEREDKG